MSPRPNRVTNTCQGTENSIARNPSKYSHTRLIKLPIAASPPRAPFRFGYPVRRSIPILSSVTVRVIADRSSRVRAAFCLP